MATARNILKPGYIFVYRALKSYLPEINVHENQVPLEGDRPEPFPFIIVEDMDQVTNAVFGEYRANMPFTVSLFYEGRSLVQMYNIQDKILQALDVDNPEDVTGEWDFEVCTYRGGPVISSDMGDNIHHMPLSFRLTGVKL